MFAQQRLMFRAVFILTCSALALSAGAQQADNSDSYAAGRALVADINRVVTPA